MLMRIYLPLIISLIAASPFVAISNAHAQVDPGLITALQQATKDINEKHTELDSLVWLSSMSEKLEKRIKNPFYRVRLLKAIHSEASLAGLDPQLVLAVIEVESGFDRYAESRVGAQGLMQIMPFWKEVYGDSRDDLFNPLVSLRYGCTILRHYLDKYQNLSDALAAYNGSLGRKTYPNLVLSRLKRTWKYTPDQYTKAPPPLIAKSSPIEKEMEVADRLLMLKP